MLLFASVIQLGRAYRRRAERMVGPYILGIWFGLFAVAAHAFTDFGIHIPSVAVFAVVTLAYGMAAAQDSDLGVHRKRRRKKTKSEPISSQAALPKTVLSQAARPISAEKEKPEIQIQGTAAAVAVAFLIAGTGIIVALDLRNYKTFNEYWLAGKFMGRPRDPTLIERKIALLKDAVALRPQDSTGHLELGKARVQGACDISMLPLEAVVGSGFPRSGMGYLQSPEFASRLAEGLIDLRTARNLSPLYPETHLLLGQHAKAFAEADPPLAYFERAKILNASDPNIWYACGLEHLRNGNFDAAAENWRRSLELSPQQFAAILTAARPRFSVDEILARILPDNPATLVQATNYYRGEPAARRAILERAAAAEEQPYWNWKARVAAAEAADMLGRTGEAETLWGKALAADPEQYDVRNGFSLFLEREERYEEAMPHLNWLINARGDPRVRDRSLFARHGADLNELLKQ